MKFVCSVAFSPPEHYLDVARACDEAGIDSIAISDHIVHPEVVNSPYPYTDDAAPRWEPFTPWPDPWVAIGAMAAVTKRLRFMTGIYVLPMRNPFLVAKAVGTAAVLSNNRVALGVGVGWMKDEFDLCEQTFAKRGKRTNEMLEVMRKLWAGGMVEHHGEFYDFPPLEMSPVPTEEIPIYVGGLSEPAMKRAAMLGDGWLSDIHTTEELREIANKLHAYRKDSDRADKPFVIGAAAKDAFDIDGYKRMRDAGVTHIMTMPWIFYGASMDSRDEKCDGIRRFGEEIIDKME